MNILVIGDVVGHPGRTILKKALPLVFKKHDIDYCIANIENAAGGFGVTKEVCDEMLDAGVDCLTSGNHIWDKKEIIPIIDLIPQLLRPLNYPPRQPGQGLPRGQGQALEGPGGHPQPLRPRLHERGPRRPLRLGLAEVERLRAEAKVILVDMHGEASSEKTAMGHFLDGRVSAVLGTHTHVPTCDHRILPKGTAYVHRPRHDRTLRLRHRGGEGEGDLPLHHRHARPVRDGQGRPALRGGGDHVDPETGRAKAIERMLLTEEDSGTGLAEDGTNGRPPRAYRGEGWTGWPGESKRSVGRQGSAEAR